MADFSATAEELTASIQEMTKVIEEIAVAANQGAEGTTNIAQKSIMVVAKADEVIYLIKADNDVRLPLLVRGSLTFLSLRFQHNFCNNF